MSLKLFLFLAPVAVGGYLVATREPAPASAAETAGTATAQKAAAPARRSAVDCRALEERLLQASAANPTNNGLEAIQRVNSMYRELQRNGCEPGGGPGTPFERPTAAMGQAPRAAMGPAPDGSGPPRQDGTSFEAGRPMVDVSRGSRH